MERRSSPRRAVRIAARLQPRPGTSWPCQIVDFCAEGLFIRYPRSKQRQIDYWHGQGHQELQVQFRTRAEGPNYLLGVRVVRQTPGGLGVMFTEPNLDAFEALLNIIGGDQTAPARLIAPDDRTGFVLRQCGKQWVRSLEPLLTDCLQELPGILLGRADQGSTPKQANTLRDLAVQLQFRHRSLLKAMLELLEEPFRASTVQVDDEPEEPPSFEDWLSIRVMVTRAEQRHRASLVLLRMRLDALGVMDATGHPAAVSPMLVCNAFSQVLQSLKPTRLANRLMQDCLQTRVLDHLGSVYRDINTVLIRQGVLPRLDPEPYLQRRRQARQQPVGSVQPSRRKRPEQILREARLAVRQPNPSSIPSLLDPDQAWPQPLAGADGWRVAVDLWQFLDGSLSRDTDAAPSRKMLIQSLRALQSSRQGRHPERPPLVPRVTRWLREQGLESVLNSPLGVELIVAGQQLDCLATSPRMSPRGRRCLRQLDLTLFIRLLESPGQLTQRHNPLRLVIDRLGHLEAADHSQPTSWPDALWRAFDRIARGQDQDDTLMAVARLLDEELAQRQSDYERNVRRVISAAQGGHKLNEARSAVDQALDDRLLPGPLPRPVLTLVENGWRDLLSLTYLRSGSGHGWQGWLNVLDDLLAAGDPQLPRDPKLRERVAEGFADLGQSLSEELWQMLEAYLSGPDDAEWITLSERFAQEETSPEPASVSPELEPWLGRVQHMPVGAWFLASGVDQPQLPVRLVWTDRARSRFLFVTPQGHKFAEWSATEIARRLDDGEVLYVARQNQSLWDEGLDRLVQQLYRQLSERAHQDGVTGFPSRRAYTWLLGQWLHLEGYSGTYSLVLLEVQPGERLGSGVLDNLWSKIGRFLERRVPEGTLLGTLAPGRFALVFPTDTAMVQAQTLRDELLTLQPEQGERTLALRVNVGVAAADPDITSARLWLQAASSALGQATPESPLIHYDSLKDSAEQARAVALARKIAALDSLDDERVLLRTQRLIPLHGQARLESQSEIQISLYDDFGQLVNARDLIPLAEKYHRIQIIDRWVIGTVMDRLPDLLQHQGMTRGVGVHLSGHSLNDQELLEFIYQKLSERDSPMESMWFEVSEATAIANPDNVARFMEEVREMGCRFCLSHLGAEPDLGRLLRQLPVDLVKLDGDLVADLIHDEACADLVAGTVRLAHYMGCEVIAPRVEDVLTLQRLRALGVDYAQGYAIEKPRLMERL